MTRAELNQIKKAITLIKNGVILYSSEYYEGLNILTKLLNSEFEHSPVDQLGDLGCGY